MKPILVFLTVRNRLEITKKCVEALYKYTSRPVHLFVFDNLTQTRVDDHFNYFCDLYKQGKIKKYVVNTTESTCNCFSKATSWNEMGLFVETHPNKEMYDWILCIDNDMIIIEPGWDDIIKETMEVVEKKVPDIMIYTQAPGGVSGTEITIPIKGKDVSARIGVNGGSGFWNVPTDFFSKIGLLELEPLVNINKRHDLNLWEKLNEWSNGTPYTFAINLPLALHTGYYNGQDLSICKKTRNNPSLNIDFEEFDTIVGNMNFEEFITWIKKDQEVFRKW